MANHEAKFCLKYFALFFIFSINQNLIAQNRNAVNRNIQNENAVYDLIKRVLPKHADHFKIDFIDKENDKDVFEIESKAGKLFYVAVTEFLLPAL